MDEVLREDIGSGPRREFDDDRLLARALLAGDPAAIGLVDGWIQVVLRIEFQALQRDWEDLRQEVRMRVFRNLRDGRFQGASELRTYVHRIARNTCIDAWRRVAARREHALDGAGAREAPEASRDELPGLMSRDLLRKLLLGASAEERRLLEMVHADNLSYAEIARRLGVAEGTIKARVFRCRDRLLAERRRLLRREGS
jgi:RNA polymerase sigma-70 factor (ECF subfamily)